MKDYEVIGWPDIQDIIDEIDFDKNATLIEPNDEMGIGDCTYLVDKEWLDTLNGEK
jgi:hypothetical protein